MTLIEFNTMTGLSVTEEQFAPINSAYMACDLDKRQFCEAYKYINKNTIAADLLGQVGHTAHSLECIENQLRKGYEAQIAELLEKTEESKKEFENVKMEFERLSLELNKARIVEKHRSKQLAAISSVLVKDLGFDMAISLLSIANSLTLSDDQ